MLRSFFCLVTFLFLVVYSANALPEKISGIIKPESAIVQGDGTVFVSEIGEFGKDGDGRILVINNQREIKPFATGLNDPKGLAIVGEDLFVTDRVQIWKINRAGKPIVWIEAKDFPILPKFLNDLASDSEGNIFVSDTGDLDKDGKPAGNGALFKISPERKISTIATAVSNPELPAPNGVLVDGSTHLLVVDFKTGVLSRVEIATGKSNKLASGFGGGDGLARDHQNQLYISDWNNGHIWKLDYQHPGSLPQNINVTFQSAADLTLDPDDKFLIVPDMKAGEIIWVKKP